MWINDIIRSVHGKGYKIFLLMSYKLRKISSSLLLRSFYLISIPIVLIQIIGIVIFFELHWDLVLKKLSNNIVNNIEIFIMNIIIMRKFLTITSNT